METEIYGMIPADALLDSAAYHLQLADFGMEQVIEHRVFEMLGEENDSSRT